MKLCDVSGPVGGATCESHRRLNDFSSEHSDPINFLFLIPQHKEENVLKYTEGDLLFNLKRESRSQSFFSISSPESAGNQNTFTGTVSKKFATKRQKNLTTLNMLYGLCSLHSEDILTFVLS